MFEGWGAAAAAAAVVGGVVSSQAAGKASDAQVEAGRDSNATQLAMFNQTREDQMPWLKAGGEALGQLSDLTKTGGDLNRDFTMDDFTADPGYQFRMDEGLKGINASAAARGGALSGGTLKGLARYGQDVASSEYSNAYNRFNNDRTQRFNRLSSLAGTGQTAATQLGQTGTQVAANIGQTQQGIGNARASGYVGQANAVNNGISSLSNFYLQRQYAQPAASPAAAAPSVQGGWGDSGTYYG